VVTAAIQAAQQAAQAAIAAASGSLSFSSALAASTQAGLGVLDAAGVGTTSIISSVESAIRTALGGLFAPRTYVPSGSTTPSAPPAP
jgi:hypothetical protein